MESKNTTPKWCFILNPAAGKGEAGKRWPGLETQLRAAGVSFEVRATEGAFHAAELAAEAIAAGFRHLAAVGGDGTAHEVVNGIFGQKTCPPQAVTFALLPIGTGNDWVKTHRIPKKFPRWLACFQQGKTAVQNVGSLTYQKNGARCHRFFINVAGLSYDGYVVKKSSERPAIFGSSFHYLWATVRWLFGFQVPSARVIFPGKKLEGKFYTINVGICRYSGGGMQLVPHAVPDDGLLALTLAAPKESLWGKHPKLLMLLGAPLFYSGKIGWHPLVSLFQVEKVAVEPMGDSPVYVEADGEFLGEAPVNIEILRGKLRVLVP